jgi:hypothetical protein
MDTENGMATNRPARRRGGWSDRLRRDKSWVPTASVVAVAVAAVAAAVMVTHTETREGSQQAIVAPTSRDVVKAPPLVAKAPPLAQASKGLNAMGGAPACRNCGVVKTVIAKKDGAQRATVSYLMEIWMDDGSLRTVEQRGALPAGSRVIIDGEVVRLAQN